MCYLNKLDLSVGERLCGGIWLQSCAEEIRPLFLEGKPLSCLEKFCKISTIFDTEGTICVVLQEYLKEEGGLSPEAMRMIGDLLNEQSLMHLALTELLYLQSDINDRTKYDWLI